jgi:hypothetical protein
MIFPVYKLDDYGNLIDTFDSGLDGYIPPGCTHITPPSPDYNKQHRVFIRGLDVWEIREHPIAPVISDIQQPAEPIKNYKSLTQAEFIDLCQSAGGMTDDLLVSAHTDVKLAALWIRFGYTQSIDRDNQFLTSLSNYIPNGVDQVLNNWPIF